MCALYAAPLLGRVREGSLRALGAGQERPHHPSCERGRIASPQQIVSQPRRDAPAARPGERHEPAPARIEGPLQLRRLRECLRDGGDGQLTGDALCEELLAKPHAADPPPLPARLGPPAREAFVVDVSPRGKLGHDLRGDIGGRAAPLEAPRELPPTPRLSREEVNGRPPRRLGVERRALTRRAAGTSARRRHRLRNSYFAALSAAFSAPAGATAGPDGFRPIAARTLASISPSSLGFS